MNEKQFKTRAIVIGKRNWRAEALLFSLYTDSYGLIEVVAEGVLKIQSKLAGHLSSLGIVEVDFVQGKAFKKLTHAYLVEPYEIKDEADYTFVNIIFELLNKAMPAEEKNEFVWRLLTRVLPRGLGSAIEQKKLLLNMFALQLTQVLGYEVKTGNCARCGKELSAPYQFKFEEHGFVCLSCEKGGHVLSQNAYELLIALNKKDLQDLQARKEANEELYRFVERYLNYVFERKWGSWEMLNSE